MKTLNKTLNNSFAIPANASLETLWDMYNMAVIELRDVEKKLAKAEKLHKEIVNKVLNTDEDGAISLAKKVSDKCAKKNSAKREVEFVKGKIAKLKQAIVNKADELGL